jgi:hypothetical protein
MTSGCQPNQVHSAIVKRSIPVRIIPDVVSSSPSEAVAYSMPSTVWDVRLEELATYKLQNNGSTNVPRRCPSNKPLGNWVAYQRTQYRLFKANENSSMTPERIESLNELDFNWGLGGIRSYASWEERLQELATYKQVNGHTNVPQIFPSNKPLGTWVANQRTQYRLFKANENSSMTPERIESLNELDFNWGLGGIRSNASWEERLQELATYKQVNGHTNVPQKCPSNKPLGHWVKNQRQEYRLFKKNENSQITTERIKSLNELDFEWSPGKRRTTLLSTTTDVICREISYVL